VGLPLTDIQKTRRMFFVGYLISLRGFGGREAGRAAIFEGGFPQGVWGREGSMWPF